MSADADARSARLHFLRSKYGVAALDLPPTSSTSVMGTATVGSTALPRKSAVVLGRAASCSSSFAAPAESDLQRRALLRWTMMPSSATLTSAVGYPTCGPRAAAEASSTTDTRTTARQGGAQPSQARPSQAASRRGAFARSVSYGGAKGGRGRHGPHAYRRLRQIGCGQPGEVHRGPASPFTPPFTPPCTSLISGAAGLARCTWCRRWPRRGCWCSSRCMRATWTPPPGSRCACSR